LREDERTSVHPQRLAAILEPIVEDPIAADEADITAHRGCLVRVAALEYVQDVCNLLGNAQVRVEVRDLCS
jgi:hypothetical protein